MWTTPSGRPLRLSHVVAKDFVCIVLPALAAMMAPATSLPLIAGIAYAIIHLALRGGVDDEGGDDDDDDDGAAEDDDEGDDGENDAVGGGGGGGGGGTRKQNDGGGGGTAAAGGNTLKTKPSPHKPQPLGAVDGVQAMGASRPYLAAYRATMTLTTAVAILAVAGNASIHLHLHLHIHIHPHTQHAPPPPPPPRFSRVLVHYGNRGGVYGRAESGAKDPCVVDFPAFPRRLGKTETFGVGLMVWVVQVKRLV